MSGSKVKNAKEDDIRNILWFGKLLAVFTFEGQQINSDWPRMIYQEWLPNSGYQEAYRYNFQLYDQRFKGIDRLDESAIDVYVPIK